MTVVKASVRAYQMGFGDCFLLRLEYQDGRMRHVLFDFGTTALPGEKGPAKKPRKRGEPSKRVAQQLKVANDIAGRCGGVLDAIVATHRHEDHISGFATNDAGTGPGDIIRKLKPKVVVQPWTENPDEARSSTGPAASDPGRRSFALALQGMQAVAATAVSEAVALRDDGELGARRAAEIRFIGEDNISNASAVRNLMHMAKAGAPEYVYAGCKTPRLARAIPGVTIRVLGPPTPKQSKGVTKQRSRDDDEFWQLQGHTFAAATSTKRSTGSAVPPEARWLTRRMKVARSRQLLGLVRALDTAMNNTSVILLLTIGKTRLLFPGDAQIEDWLYSLNESKDSAAIRKELSEVAFYKVGHHGSLNATPKSLWNLFKNRGGPKKRGRLLSAVSTMGGKHGTTVKKTEVPRQTLYKALETDTHLTSTWNAKAKRSIKELFVDIEIPLR